jgi:hypothetical protein
MFKVPQLKSANTMLVFIRINSSVMHSFPDFFITIVLEVGSWY